MYAGSLGLGSVLLSIDRTQFARKLTTEALNTALLELHQSVSKGPQ